MSSIGFGFSISIKGKLFEHETLPHCGIYTMYTKTIIIHE
jgi:hypothetical protein